MRYRVGEFAALTGVTVRALQHYDRLGLLTPSRTDAGHRVYVPTDQQRMRHILALRADWDAAAADRIAASRVRRRMWLRRFRAQRARLEQSRAGIEEAIRRSCSNLKRRATRAETSLLDRLAAGVEMLDALEAMRGYFSDEAWMKWGERYFHDWPSAAWRALFRDIESALSVDPASERAQELLDRSTALWQADIGADVAPGSGRSRGLRQGVGRPRSLAA